MRFFAAAIGFLLGFASSNTLHAGKGPIVSGPAPGFKEAVADTRKQEAQLSLEKFVVFDGGVCGDVLAVKKVAAVSAHASSFLKGKSVSHTPDRLLDGKTETAWVEGTAGNGEGERIIVFVNNAPSAVSIIPGYGKDKSRWQKNCRVSAVLIRFLVADQDYHKTRSKAGVTNAVGESLLYANTQIYAKMKRVNGQIPVGQRQYIDFANTWVQNMESTEVVAMEITITEVDKAGAKYQDTCVSEVALFETGKREASRCPEGHPPQ